MQLDDQRASGNVEDRRGIGMVGRGLGVGGVVIAVIAYFLGFDPSTVLNVAEQVTSQRETREAPKGAPADQMGQFVSKILGSTEVVWGKIFQQSNSQYRPPTLVLYDGQVRSACGMGQSAMGPAGPGCRARLSNSARDIPYAIVHKAIARRSQV